MATEELTIDVKANTRAFEEHLLALSRQSNAFSGAISRAFRDAVAGGKSFEQVLSSLALQIAGLALDKALAPLSNLAGGLIDGLLGAFTSGGGQSSVTAFADGGVINTPTLFPLARNLGLAGEAGAEAVLPLARGSDGALGVRSAANATTAVTFNVTTADAASFRKSEAQVTAMLARAVGRGRRAL